MRTVTGLFDDYSDACSAVTKLEAAGIPSNDISIVSNKAGRVHRDSDVGQDAATGAGIGAAVGGAGGLLTGLGLMAIPGVGPVVAAGWLAMTAAGAVAGAVTGGAVGGLIGALTDSGVPEDDAHLYAEGVRRGGSLVTAKVDDARASEAQAILQGSNWVDPVERRRAYNEQGWTRFDDRLDPYAPEQIAQERDRYRPTII
ncbi:general stress protein [Rhizobium laguerreae]|uniref:General stress protein 17M-like domain-containing protein n=1 Tax=Rhizobium laguerreae TaxID=1076926 RepID=A0AAX2QBX3_9HYPH|nr:general stress protein [Rhizobium laguerreae]MBY3279774.1 hypothetical protein [Rhizobium laguerreae]NKM36409.1 hypothetical protein [Rhizobium laguerreae]NKM42963.1 hypothetical protein [Rhizobium laguerreae]TCU14572.1 hypothetical protein EV131_12268 [Rhizobium laguerreae]UFW66874.1 hypothetical protein RlegWSM1455_03800 [Rhizobium laguerreae]